MIQENFKENNKLILIDLFAIYDNIKINILGEEINLSPKLPKGSIIVPILFFCYINKTIKNH